MKQIREVGDWALPDTMFVQPSMPEGGGGVSGGCV